MAGAAKTAELQDEEGVGRCSWLKARCGGWVCRSGRGLLEGEECFHFGKGIWGGGARRRNFCSSSVNGTRVHKEAGVWP